MKLYGDYFRISPFVFSVVATLKEKGLEYEYQPLHLEDAETESSAFQSLTPTRMVPVLEADGIAIGEATAIIEALEERYPACNSVYPHDPIHRARARMLCAWLRSSIQALRDERSAEIIFYPETRTGIPLSETARYQAERMFDFAESLLTASPSKTLFAELSIADYDLTYALLRLTSSGDPVPPRLREYVQHMISRPIFREHLEWKRPAFRPYV